MTIAVWWIGVAVAAVVTVAAVLTPHRRIVVASALVSWVWGWAAHRRIL